MSRIKEPFYIFPACMKCENECKKGNAIKGSDIEICRNFKKIKKVKK